MGIGSIGTRRGLDGSLPLLKSSLFLEPGWQCIIITASTILLCWYALNEPVKIGVGWCKIPDLVISILECPHPLAHPFPLGVALKVVLMKMPMGNFVVGRLGKNCFFKEGDLIPRARMAWLV